MSELVKEGWYEDPAGRHEYRWFSVGAPTDLVRDGPATGHDPISMADPALFDDIHLEGPPDTAPLLHSPAADPNLVLVNFGMGPVGVVNTNAPRYQNLRYWECQPGVTEIVFVLLPPVILSGARRRPSRG